MIMMMKKMVTARVMWRSPGLPDVTDMGDGSYVVESPPLQCRSSRLVVLLNGEELTHLTTTTTIRPGATSPLYSFAATNPKTARCAGIRTEFFIQAVDEFGCNLSMGGDHIHVTISGPDPVAATVSDQLDGRYKVSYTALLPGEYRLTAWLLRDGKHHPLSQVSDVCVHVCNGYALYFDGQSSLEVIEPAMSQIDLTGTTGLTISAWILPERPQKLPYNASAAPDPPAWIFMKGSIQQAGESIKGWGLQLTPDRLFLKASVYVGLGEYRTVSGLFALSQSWTHVAAVYSADGMRFTLYQDGVNIGWESYEFAKAPKANEYYHPLTIGFNFVGRIDEPMVWSSEMTLSEIEQLKACPIWASTSKVAYYSNFNEGEGSTVRGWSSSCLERDETCMIGTLHAHSRIGQGPIFIYSEVTYSNLGALDLEAFRANISDGYTALLDVEQEFQVVAFDKCGYELQHDDWSMHVRLQQYAFQWINQRHEGIEYPQAISFLPEDMPPCSHDYPTCSNGIAAAFGPDAPSGNTWTCNFSANTGSYYLEVDMNNTGLLPLRGADSERRINVTVTGAPPVDVFFVEGPGLYNATAGVYSWFEVTLRDRGGERVNDWAHDFTQQLRESVVISHVELMEGAHVDVQRGKADGSYRVVYLATVPGEYSIVVQNSSTHYSWNLLVEPPSTREMVVNSGDVPQSLGRFEHSAVEHEGSVYVFGGAGQDKSYQNDVWVLESSGGAGIMSWNTFSYVRPIFLKGKPTPGKNATVEIIVNTEELVYAGLVGPSCGDIVFTEPDNGPPLSFYMDSYPGCTSPVTIFWVLIPSRLFESSQSPSIEMYYGNPHEVLGGSDPTSPGLFAFYDGFESGNLDQFTFVPHCGSLQPNPSSFNVSSDFPVAGYFALHAERGKAGVIEHILKEGPYRDFVFKAWFWDCDSNNASQYISPDYVSCRRTTEEGKIFLPDAGGPLEARSTAVGVYTPSVLGQFAVSAPWESAGVARMADWHLFEIRSNITHGTTIYIDHAVAKRLPEPIYASKVHISNGFGGSEEMRNWSPEVLPSTAFWDEILVVPIDVGVAPPVVPSLADSLDRPVSRVAHRAWSRVKASGVGPSPRYGHSAVVYEGKMYVFGGERSAYTYNDLWAFDLKTSSWKYLTPATSAIPPARFDHAAVVLPHLGAMLVLNGRSTRALLEDAWLFYFGANTWRPLRLQPSLLGPRFGHTATVLSQDTVLIFGGYSGYGLDGLSNELFMLSTTDWSLELLPPTPLTPRYAHCAVAKGKYFYVAGGSDGNTELTDLWKLDTDVREWVSDPAAVVEPNVFTTVVRDIPIAESREFGAYSGVCLPVPGGFLMQGGHNRGRYRSSTYFYPL